MLENATEFISSFVVFVVFRIARRDTFMEFGSVAARLPMAHIHNAGLASQS